MRLVLLIAVLVAAPAHADDEPPLACPMDWLVESARAGIADGSPAYQRYLKALLKESALTMPVGELLAAVAAETDPALLEALGAALATRASYDEDPGLVAPLLERAALDADPQLRAAAVRALRATGSIETMAALGDEVSYELLVQDPEAAVRAAVADNLIAENDDVYGGRDARVADAAAKVAAASPDPAVAATILGGISMERASADAIASITTSLTATDPQLRAGAALALGSAPSSAATKKQLVDRYRREPDRNVRVAILQALARLGQASAIPTLRSLRGVAPDVDPEIDRWIEVLGLGLQEWHLILREKLKRTRGEAR
jgi:HEAT repeat protein